MHCCIVTLAERNHTVIMCTKDLSLIGPIFSEITCRSPNLHPSLLTGQSFESLFQIFAAYYHRSPKNGVCRSVWQWYAVIYHFHLSCICHHRTFRQNMLSCFVNNVKCSSWLLPASFVWGHGDEIVMALSHAEQIPIHYSNLESTIDFTSARQNQNAAHCELG